MAVRGTEPRLSVGPVPYYWPRDETLAFYERVAGTRADIVYLGENVCPKRTQLRTSDWLALGRELQAAGKEVVLSTLALVEAESDLVRLRRLCRNDEFPVEANDMGAVRLLEGRAFVSGPGLNIYNQGTLSLLARLGLTRWVFPVELSRDTLRDLQALRPAGVETEVFAYGRLPLAYSARCFTARAHNLPKDDCQYRCLDYPDGLTLSTQEAEPFLNLNGIQTQSARIFNLLPRLDELRDLRVDVLRISPQSRHTERVVELFHGCLAGSIDADEGTRELEALARGGTCDGYWTGDPGLARELGVG